MPEEKFRCPLCRARHDAGDHRQDYRCAFTANGEFDPGNRMCATMEKLESKGYDHCGCDQTVTLVVSQDMVGTLAISRYKRRPNVCQAVLLGIDPGPVQPLDWKMAKEWLEALG